MEKTEHSEPKAPKINLDIEELLKTNSDQIKSVLVNSIIQRIDHKIQYDNGLGKLFEKWMDENVAPAVLSYLESQKDEITKAYLQAYEKALQAAMEERAK